MSPLPRLILLLGPGAGDLATAAFAGGRLGTTVLRAVLVGALLFFLSLRMQRIV